jgi:hypothetical protein
MCLIQRMNDDLSAFRGDTDILCHQLNVAFDPTETSSLINV